MGFTTQLFIFAFFPLCMITYYFVILVEKNSIFEKISEKIRIKDWILILFSTGFYMWTCYKNIIVLYAYILFVYIIACLIDNARKKGYFVKVEADKIEDEKGKKIYVAAMISSIGVALLTCYLAYNKYLPILTEIYNLIFGASREPQTIIAPLGISFITFSAISYLIDIKRGEAEKGTIVDCLLYILFFPKVVSGPIILWKNFKNQIKERIIEIDLIITGVNRIIVGFAKKVILADTFGSCIAEMGSYPVDRITAIGAILLYMLQIYYDFSGYSDIAIGISNLFGFKFDNNFNFPYRSKSITEFWRRWHISLGAWFREYVYFPLGGSRAGLTCTLRNLFIVFALTGIWHGCGKTYILWGLINAFFVIIERIIKDKPRYKSTPNGVKYIITMFIVFCFWQLFRFPGLRGAINWFAIALGIVKFDGIYYTWPHYFDAQMITLVLIGIIGSTILGNKEIKNSWNKFTNNNMGFILQELGLLILFIISIMFMVSSTYSPFIYFQY